MFSQPKTVSHSLGTIDSDRYKILSMIDTDRLLSLSIDMTDISIFVRRNFMCEALGRSEATKAFLCLSLSIIDRIPTICCKYFVKFAIFNNSPLC